MREKLIRKLDVLALLRSESEFSFFIFIFIFFCVIKAKVVFFVGINFGDWFGLVMVSEASCEERRVSGFCGEGERPQGFGIEMGCVTGDKSRVF